METPYVSVILPVYNGEKYLKECLDSIVGQTFSDLEVVVVDDGSTDSTPEILASYSNKIPRLNILTTSNGGTSRARNLGISESKGEYVLFVDCDDILDPDAIKTLLERAEGSGSLIACGMVTTDLGHLGCRVRKRIPRELSGREACLKVLYQNDFLIISPWAQIYHRSVFDADHLFKEAMRYEDLELMPRLYAAVPKVAFTDRIIYYYRQHSGSFIHKLTADRFDSLKATDLLSRSLAPLGEDFERAAADRKLSASFNAYILASRDKRFADIADSCWRTIRTNRRRSLTNRQVRLKNKLGILLSYLGRPLFTVISKAQQ